MIFSDWAQKLGQSIQIPTVSWNDTYQNSKEIFQLIEFLYEIFPTVFSSEYVRVYPVNTLSLLLRVQGVKNTKNPYLLAGHLDVVPPGDYERYKIKKIIFGAKIFMLMLKVES